MWKYKQVIVIRKDIKMSPAKLGVQIAHASLTPILNNINDNKEVIYEWFANGNEQKKVILSAKTLTQLLNIHDKAIDAGIPCYIIRDAGLTELEPNTTTALGFLPMHNDEIDKITKRLSIYK